MSAAAHTHGRRGACPGLSAPMQTGDGLLARIQPVKTIYPAQMAGLCAAAREHGNGIIEITARGSIQVRGLTPATAPAFATAIAQLRITGPDGVPVIADPLTDLTLDGAIVGNALAFDMRRALTTRRLKRPVAPKVSVVIDGSGALHLDALTADVRLRAETFDDGPYLHVAIAGDATSARPIGAVAYEHAIETVVSLVGVIAAHGPDARAKDIVATAGLGAFRDVVADRLVEVTPPPPQSPSDPIGRHELCGNELAIGIGLAFGHTDVTLLEKLVEVARDLHVAFISAPGRALLVVGIAPKRVKSFNATARRLGFIVDPNDPRRRVVACAGAPICASGEIAARALAPSIVQTAAALLDTGEVIHISGCAKGCAHRGPAALTVIGRDGACDLLLDGAPAGSCAVEALPQRLVQLAPQRSGRHG